MSSAKKTIETFLATADVKINGDRPWDIKVRDEECFTRILSQGTLGVGESFMDGSWDCEAMDEMVYRVLRFSDRKTLYRNFSNLLHIAKTIIFNVQTRMGSRKVVDEHYDLDNNLYMGFLDPYNQYTCGYFKNTNDLNLAQEQKLDLICKKLQLKPTDKVLDIGCGWGGFAKYAAERYGCHVTGISISDEQIDYAREYTKGLPVEILKMDYRDLTGTYDKVVSVGMFEHVGYKNYRTFFKIVKKCLSSDGLFLLHTIGKNNSLNFTDPWLGKYVFPNSVLPSAKKISQAHEGLFMMEDWHNFGHYYDPTLIAWWNNFNKSWPKLKEKYGERFYRMFQYYFLSCAGSFRARDFHLWQIVFSHEGVVGGYESLR